MEMYKSVIWCAVMMSLLPAIWGEYRDAISSSARQMLMTNADSIF